MKLFFQRLTMLIFIITIICAMATMALSWQTGKLKYQQVKIENEIEEVRTGIRVLRAEWSRLNQPSLLQVQAEKYLDLQKNIGNTQIENIQELPSRQAVMKLINEQRSDKNNMVKNNQSEHISLKNKNISPSNDIKDPIRITTKEAVETFDPINDILSAEVE